MRRPSNQPCRAIVRPVVTNGEPRTHRKCNLQRIPVKSLSGAKTMNFRQQLQRRDSWLHLDFNVTLAVIFVVMLISYVVSWFGG
jgi:hypothetical protein